MKTKEFTKSITQVLGVAYSYQQSLAFRRKQTAGLGAHHSSQHQDFSYFLKALPETVVGNGEALVMRHHPLNDAPTSHWPEAELAVLLGANHQIVAYTLANDFTAHALEFEGRTADFDGTFYGKCWPGSCALGPRWFMPEEIGDDSNLDVGLKIVRAGEIIYDRTYNTSRRKHPFGEIPGMLVKEAKRFGYTPPPSKKIQIGSDGFLIEGTVILLGTGIIVREQHYSQKGDILTVYSPNIQPRELTNTVTIVP